MNEALQNFDISSITGITADSRKVKKGYLFAALPGEVHDGHNYIEAAITQGASVILSDEKGVKKHNILALNVPREALHKAFSKLVAAFYARQPGQIIAVTGTNGKSSVVHFTHQIWQALGKKSEALGTLNGGLTTPDPVTLHEHLKTFAEKGTTHCALEASSHGLAQYRIDGATIKVAAFTSFSQDHLDYHADMEEYLNAKIRLFTEVLEEGGTAVLNADSPEYVRLRKSCEARKLKIISYGEKGDLKLDLTKDFPLIGHFQKMNALCALGCVIAEEGVNKEDAIQTLKTLKSPPGRLQHITNKNKNRHAYVDYAHTPDALENVLKELREYTKGRLICVFGCGGDRDKTKRPLMGQIADLLCDIVIITDDNPRNENPEDIREQIRKTMQGLSEVHVISNRRDAICRATQVLNEDDILLVAGKGHERVQILGAKKTEFDDCKEVEKALYDLG